MATEDLFDVIDRLEKLDRFESVAVGRILHARFSRGAGSNPYFDVLAGTPGEPSPAASAELRVALQPQGAQDGLIIVGLRPQIQVTRKQILARFGEPAQVIPSHPQDPQPKLGLRYTRPRGLLTFSCQPQDPGQLISVVLDRTELR